MGAPGTTTGPWKAEPADMFGDHNVTLKDTSECCLAIAAVVSNLRPAAEVATNANLIAAAPDLYAALEAVLKVRVDGWENIWAGANRCQGIARAALAKARGEA